MGKLTGKAIDKMKEAEYTQIDYSAFKGIEDDGKIYGTLDDLKLDNEELSSLKSVGVNLFDNAPAGKFIMYGADSYRFDSMIPGVEILPLKEAVIIHPEIMDKYYFKAISKDQDEFTEKAYSKGQNGYFIHVKKNVVVETPLQTAMFMYHEMSTMCIHNIVVLEEGSSLHLVTGCLSGCAVNGGLHIAVSEQFVGKGAKLVSTMVHDWGPEFIVRPRTATIVEENGSYVSNYYSVKPAGNIQMNPLTKLEGRKSNAKYMTVLASFPDTYCDIGGTVLLEGEDSGAELISRAVNYGGTVIQSGLLIGAARGARAHVDCSGLMMSGGGIIEAVPGLRAVHPDAKMSHEAAIGRIDTGEINYLQSKGLDERQAVSLIVRGFLDVSDEIEGLTPELERTIREISELSGHGED